jgi:hypothetical protein
MPATDAQHDLADDKGVEQAGHERCRAGKRVFPQDERTQGSGDAASQQGQGVAHGRER